MSTVGQALGGLVGGIGGFFLGGPMGALYGAQIGLMAGGSLDPARLPTIEGPRLNDLTVQFSTYGAVIPRVYGDCTVHGNVLWVEANALKETVTETSQGGGKGGRRKKQKVRKYTYSATFAVGLCRGPVGSLGRIWIGPDLVYAPGEPYEVSFRFYRGRDTQNPDPRMQATLGVDIPAWRGLCYLVFEDLPLARYGNSLAAAQVRVEILNSGDSRPGIRVKELIEAECLLSGTL
ncbi:MAG: hypothetical protein NFV71_15135, partial [Candidatus Accumulibacter sp.]|nr:hypothetical protein [Accumulibacter sp.]MDS4050807.1 hypothetical protein [Accumulibacter sp.]